MTLPPLGEPVLERAVVDPARHQAERYACYIIQERVRGDTVSKRAGTRTERLDLLVPVLVIEEELSVEYEGQSVGRLTLSHILGR